MTNNRIETDKSLKLLAKSSIIVFIAILLSKIFTYLYRAIVARYYGPEIYGLLALSLVIVGWFRLFGGFGLADGLLRFISFYRGKKKKDVIKYLIKTSGKFLLMSSIISALVLFFSADFIAENLFHNQQLGVFLRWFSISIPVILLGGIFITTLRAYEKIAWFSFIENLVGNFVKVALLALLIFIGLRSQQSLALSYTAGFLAILLISYIVCKPILKSINKKESKNKNPKKAFKNLLSYSLPLVFFSLTFSAFGWVDIVLLGIFRGAEEVGFYDAAMPIALLMLIFKDIFTYLFFPLVTKEYAKKNYLIVKQLSKQITKWVFILSVPFFVLLLVFPEFFIRILFGSEYLVAANALRLISIGVFFTTTLEVARDLLSIKGKSKTILIDVLVALLLNIGLNLALIPSYGINGAALATSISIVFLQSLYLYQSRKYMSVNPLQTKIIKILLTGLILGVILLFMKINLGGSLISDIILMIFFTLLYLLVTLKNGSLDEHDKEILGKLLAAIIKFPIGSVEKAPR